MARYINSIHINEIFHLKDVDIPVAGEDSDHLILTGKNGSGKTQTLNAIVKFLDKVKTDGNLHFLDYKTWMENDEKKLEQFSPGTPDYIKTFESLKKDKERIDDLYGQINIDFGEDYNFIHKYLNDEFIIVYYKADRKAKLIQIERIENPKLNKKGASTDLLTDKFISFLVHIKNQEAWARNEGDLKYANEIKEWFQNFQNLLKRIFDDENLELTFDPKNYQIGIKTEGKTFGLDKLSDGFSAILDIIGDLILKMQDGETPSFKFDKGGIILIDEVETHLHLKLQKEIMEILTTLFPNIQFIVSTHSPFVLNSIPNTTAFDLEHQQPINDLTEYSAQALTEGYFRVSDESNYAKERLYQLQSLLEKDNLDAEEKTTAKNLLKEFKEIPEAVAPDIRSQFNEIIFSNAINVRKLQQ